MNAGLSSSHISAESFEGLDDGAASSAEVLGEWEAAKHTHEFYGMRTPEMVQVESIIWADGGDVVTLKAAASKCKPPKSGGTRREIQEFARDSRRRLLTFVNSIDRRQIEADRMWFLTLTYPSVWPDDPKKWKNQLQALQLRLRRTWSISAGIWKLEPQRRGAPHFHLILVVPASMSRGLAITGKHKRGERIVTNWDGGQLSEFRTWLSKAWYDVVGSGDEKHLRAGTNCEPMEAWGKVAAYAAKYLGKDCQFVTAEGSTQKVGRFWGVWSRESFPVKWCSSMMIYQDWAMFRRTVRRWAEKKGWRVGHLRARSGSATAFVPWADMQRLIAWLVHPPCRLPWPLRRRMEAIGFTGSINEWFAAGEQDRQHRHREEQTLSRIRFGEE